MEIVKFTFNPIQENTYLAIDDDKNVVIIDPGCYFEEERQFLKNYISKRELTVKALLNTHGHLDHIMGNDFVKREYGVDLYLHEKDVVTLQMGSRSAQMYGLNEFQESPLPDRYLKEGEKLTFGGISFEVIFCPGHAPGHVVFYSPQDKLVINGDVLFKGSYGRVDLPGGDLNTLKDSITQKMFSLPEDTLVYTGHGPETTIGEEKQSNPILW
ncbi:MBL fold hydrolase [Brumimicrobium salinarum]|uniref:MBL fold hydrolase n=1 Tax=Brumimicrobium salinarum TaxID=2058658 RepID=A0A2I0QZY3_9FLAO|nr:MBL fold metallo-hydrolase [Brumimicrobium salinarum]PKR79855.1 MBL fold hydrolase [Brumimicrobium salinarum]